MFQYLMKMLLFALEDPDAKKIAHDMSMVPLIPELVRLVKERVIFKTTCRGVSIMDMIAEDNRPKGLTLIQICCISLAGVVGTLFSLFR